MPDSKHPPSAHRRRRGAVLLASWLALALFAAAPSCGQNTLLALDPAGSPTEHLLSPDEEAVFTLELAADQYVWLQVEQVSIDATIAVLDPAGAVMDEIDFEHEPRRFESVEFITHQAGPHRLRLHAHVGETPNGVVRVRVGEVRARRPNDDRLIAAERLYNEATGLARRRTETALTRAAGLYREALSGFEAERNVIGVAKTQTNLGLVRRRQGDLDAAIAAYETALAQWRTLDDVRGETDTLLNLAVAYYGRHDFVRAQALGETAVARAREARPAAEPRMLDSLARTLEALGEPDQALERLERALTLRHAANDRRGVARSRARLGALYQRLGAYQHALDHLHGALDALTAAGDERDRMAVLNSLGVVYNALGQYPRAVLFFEQARAASRALADRDTETRIESNLGWARHFEGDPERAVAHYRAALIGLASDDTASQAQVRANLGRSLLVLGDAAQARTELTRARRLARAAGDARAEAQAVAELGLAETALGNPEAAEQAWHHAMTTARDAQDPRTEAAARRGLASLARASDDFDTAQTHLEASIEVLEGLRASVDGDRHRATFLASKRAHYTALMDLLMARHAAEPEAGWARRALVASERARARSLADVLTGAINPGVGLDAQEAAHLDRLDRRLRTLDHQRTATDPGRRAAADAAFEIALADAERARAKARPATPGGEAIRHGQALDADAIQDLLDPDTGLLVVALGETRSIVWLVTPDRIDAHVGPGSATIEGWARTAHGALTARGERPAGESLQQRATRVQTADDDWRTAARSLSEALLGPFASHLPKRLAVVADGALVYLPFAALPLPGHDHDTPLLTRYEVVRLPSASTLRLLRDQSAQRPPARRLLAAIADPVFGDDDPRLAIRTNEAVTEIDVGGPIDPMGARAPHERASPNSDPTTETHFARLPFAAREAQAIVDLLPPELPPTDVLLATGFDATRALVTGGDLARYRILHFATHGIIDSQFPERSALVLSLRDERGNPRDGFVHLADLFALRLEADLVVLSACRTALGEAIAGEGHLGLTRGFLYAGASRVISSLWAVQDKATQVLMTRLYSAMLDDRQSPAASLRDAQLALLSQPRYQAPYFWAGFELQGDWR